MSEQESVSERELAEYLSESVFGDGPKSVGEALAAAEEPEPVAEEIPEPPIEEPPVVVTDEPQQPAAPIAEEETPPAPGEEVPAEEEQPAEEEEADENVVWAKKKYGDAPEQWAKAARNMERHISQLTNEKREAEQLAQQWYEYAQQQQAQPQSVGMPLSTAEEQWVEQSLANPMEFARQAAFSGNAQLYNAVIGRVAEENPMLAGQIGAQVQMDLQQAAWQEQQTQQVHPQAELPIALAQSFVRLGMDMETVGPMISDKIGELGEYHPYVQAILSGDDGQRDLAIQAVHDLARSSTLTKRVVRDEQQAERIKREGELRREAAGVVTGAPHTPPQKQDPFMQAMEDEWRQRGQWYDEPS